MGEFPEDEYCNSFNSDFVDFKVDDVPQYIETGFAEVVFLCAMSAMVGFVLAWVWLA